MDLYKKIIRLGRNVTSDLRYGAFLGGVKKTPFADVGAYDTANSDYEVLSHLFSDNMVPNIAGQDVLVDVGCGKGRVLNYWLDKFPGNKIYGIELDPGIATQSSRRLRDYSNVTILCGDVRDLIPTDGSLFYLFNPFDETILNDFLYSLRQSIAGSTAKSISVIYYNPVHIDVFFADEACEVREIILPDRFHKAFLIKLNSDT